MARPEIRKEGLHIVHHCSTIRSIASNLTSAAAVVGMLVISIPGFADSLHDLNASEI